MLVFQFIYRAFCSLLFPCLLLFSPFVLSCNLCSQTQLCSLRLIGGMESGKLEEVLTNRLQGARPPAERANLDTRGYEGCAWYRGCCSLLQHSWDSTWATVDGRGDGLRRQLPSCGPYLPALEDSRSFSACPGSFPQGWFQFSSPISSLLIPGVGAEAGSWNADSPEPNLPRTSRSWLVTQKPLVTVVE